VSTAHSLSGVARRRTRPAPDLLLGARFGGAGETSDGQRLEGSLVLATGIVEGGGAWAHAQAAEAGAATVLAGDAIVAVADGTGARRILTEGCSYDEVVAAIGKVNH